MKHVAGLLPLLAGVLAGCSALTPVPPGGDADMGFDAANKRAPTRCVVEIFIDDNDLLVTHEPAHTRRCDEGSGGKVKMVWKLPLPVWGQPTYSFASPGIVFDKQPMPSALTECKKGGSEQAHKCVFPGRTGKQYPYTIVVLKDGQPWKSLDPTIFND